MAVRELLRQLHPRAIITARLGGRIAAENTLTQVVVTQFLFVFTNLVNVVFFRFFHN